MSTKLDMDYVRAIRKNQQNANEGFETLVREVDRLEGQVGAYEKACIAITETISTHGTLWGTNRGTTEPSATPESEILLAVQGIIDQAQRYVGPNHDDAHAKHAVGSEQ